MKFKTFTIYLIGLFFFQNNSIAQWESLSNDIIPQDHRVWSIKVAPDKSVWALSTFDNFPPTNQVPKLHRSTDEGKTWTETEIPEGISTIGRDISPIDSNKAFIALDTKGLYQTIDGGLNWIKVDSFLYRPFYVHFFNEMEGWVLALNQSGFLVMCTTKNGAKDWLYSSYTEQAEGTSLPPLDATESVLSFTFSLNSAYDYDDTSIIIGTRTGKYWISNDKGYNWKRRYSPLNPKGRVTSNVAMKDSTTFMLVGDIIAANNSGESAINFTTTDGGATWIEGESRITAAATHYIPNSDSIFIMTGHNNFGWGSEGTAITYDYGATWDIIDNNSIIAIDFVDENTGYGTCCNNGWFTANGQIHKWNFELPTSTTNLDLDKIDVLKISPNPVSDILVLETNSLLEGKDLRIEIFSVNGQLVFQKNYRQISEIQIDTHHLATGFYTLRLSNETNAISEKFIKN